MRKNIYVNFCLRKHIHIMICFRINSLNSLSLSPLSPSLSALLTRQVKLKSSELQAEYVNNTSWFPVNFVYYYIISLKYWAHLSEHMKFKYVALANNNRHLHSNKLQSSFKRNLAYFHRCSTVFLRILNSPSSPSKTHL